jgi:hypothetical protein
MLVAFVSMGFVFYDVMSYTATDSETLNPAGNVVETALVVYDPGISGFRKICDFSTGENYIFSAAKITFLPA